MPYNSWLIRKNPLNSVFLDASIQIVDYGWATPGLTSPEFCFFGCIKHIFDYGWAKPGLTSSEICFFLDAHIFDYGWAAPLLALNFVFLDASIHIFMIFYKIEFMKYIDVCYLIFSLGLWRVFYDICISFSKLKTAFRNHFVAKL
jgi:hypothetical protein